MDIHTEKARAFFFSLLAALLLFVGSKAAVRIFLFIRAIYTTVVQQKRTLLFAPFCSVVFSKTSFPERPNGTAPKISLTHYHDGIENRWEALEFESWPSFLFRLGDCGFARKRATRAKKITTSHSGVQSKNERALKTNRRRHPKLRIADRSALLTQ